MIQRLCVVGLVAVVLFGVAGCKDDTSEPVGGDQDALCGVGERLTVDGEDLCVYDKELIIEGFMCPAELSRRFDFVGFAVCSALDLLTDPFMAALRDSGREPRPLAKADPGDGCDQPGAVVEANDGCNTCTCTEGGWSCTEIACGVSEGCGLNGDEGACEGEEGCVWLECPQDDFDCPSPEGAFCIELAEPGGVCEDLGISIPATDGCNSCFCDEGRYGCTEIGCGEPECTDGDTMLSENACDCVCEGGQWACNPEGCDEVACEEGVELPAGDGCNTCSCPNGVWECTDMDCQEPECTPGDTFDAEDGCSCQCSEDGEWDCNPVGCDAVVCEEGVELPAGDGCNTCSCPNGVWECTEEVCGEPEGCGINNDEGSCIGETGCAWVICPQDDVDCPSREGEFCTPEAVPGDACFFDSALSIPATDGCNTCFCDGGFFSCTEIACGD